MLDRRAYRTARELAEDAVNHEGDLRAASWRMTGSALRRALGRVAVAGGDALRRLGWSLLRPYPGA